MTFTPHPLAALRSQRNLTQAQLSSLAGVSTASIARVESGARISHGHVPFKIAEALGVSVDEIVNPEQVGIDNRLIAALYLGVTPDEVDELKAAL